MTGAQCPSAWRAAGSTPSTEGVYAVGHARLSQHGWWMAAVLAAGEGAVLSHLAAAKLWEVWRRRVPGIDVTVPRNGATAQAFASTERATSIHATQRSTTESR